MRRARLGWCASRRGDVESDEVRRTDEELDALGRGDSPSSADPTLQLLSALVSDVDDGAEAPARPRPRRRRLLSRAALSTGVAIAALSGTGMAAATVVAGGVSPLHPIHQAVDAFYDGDATREAVSPAVLDVRGLLGQARSALASGSLTAAEDALQQARQRLSSVHGPAAAGLADAIQELAAQLAQVRDGGRAPEPVATPSSSGPESDGSREGLLAIPSVPSTLLPEKVSSSGASEPSPSTVASAEGSESTGSPSPSSSPSESGDTKDGGESDGTSGDSDGGGDGDTGGSGGKSDGSGSSDQSGQGTEPGGGERRAGSGQASSGVGGGSSDQTAGRSPSGGESSGRRADPGGGRRTDPDRGRPASPDRGGPADPGGDRHAQSAERGTQESRGAAPQVSPAAEPGPPAVSGNPHSR